MKEKKNRQRLYLQRRNNRWKWMAGATAATAAGVTASQAYGITINLLNNYISGADGNHLNADLTGDGHPDLTIANAFNYAWANSYSFSRSHGGSARVSLNGVFAKARSWFDAIPDLAYEYLGSRSARWGIVNKSGPYTYGTSSLTGAIPIFFKDLHINGGAPTEGFLEVTVIGPGAEIQLDSLTYTNNTPLNRRTVAVPDQGSSLALLAMGAGGVLASRRCRAAHGWS